MAFTPSWFAPRPPRRLDASAAARPEADSITEAPMEDIEKRTPTNNSVMPEGLLDTLKDEEIRDLIAYLQKK